VYLLNWHRNSHRHYLWREMTRARLLTGYMTLVFLTLVGCGDVKRDQSRNHAGVLWTRSDGISILEFAPCCRLPVIPGLAIMIRKDLIDTYLLNVSSPNLKMQMTYSPGFTPTELEVSDINVKSNDDCKKIISDLSKKVSE
jgi:hypothetical protein